jgi:glutamate dehydrogenase
MASSWKKSLQEKLIKQFGAKKGAALYAKYDLSYPPSYLDECTPAMAVTDILEMEQLSDEHTLEIVLSQTSENTDYPIHMRLFQFKNPIPLSDILPMLENMDLRTFNEHPYIIKLANSNIWISDFSVTYPHTNKPDIDAIKDLFEDALIQTRLGFNENDGFNKLVLAAQLSWREITMIRAYAKYLHQAGLRFSQTYIEQAVANHPDITQSFVQLFNAMHNPREKSREKTIEKLNQQIQQHLENVSSLDEDRILRQLWETLKATLRTNYFQTLQNKPKEYLSFKLESNKIPELPLPTPLYEVFVYSPRFEAIHLRAAKVSRGGIRWSDRREDFRTEVLGLMKAQTVKNSVIIPSGAKGGFVLKALPEQASREMVQLEVIACYKSFIRGLLDITDNIKNNKIIHPENVVCYDDDDPYLVVAADKGTATFSDTANGISKEYDFWLGDAFASGGSAGYDHKKMGITARGAWESIKRHFREIDINIEKTTFTVVGIGDMSGDVFGNGAIYTPNMKLIAAFDHRDIFIDPTPNAEKTYAERLRLFELPTSSWQDFNAKLISAGGGVFKRSSKSITITPEMKKALGIQEAALTPNALIRAILCAPVDLLFNGGIGTYVKASYESHADVGDKTNEFCRINGIDLRCRVVGEGGNLGFTQLGRIEYALQGGLIYTDFIDNSAGVDCSDHEVNIKILLNKQVREKKLTEAERNKLLKKMTSDVSKLVLRDNYNQALVLGFSALHSVSYTNLYENFIKDLEASKSINRTVEFLPQDKIISERQAAGLGFTRPELAVLLAYAKIHIKSEILKSNIPEDAYFNDIIQTAFPTLLWKEYRSELEKHSLKREIIATQLSNQAINYMGITFAYRLQAETNASIADIVRAHAVAMDVYQAAGFSRLIESLDFKVPVSIQYDLLHHIRRLMNLATRWFLRNNRLTGDISKVVAHYRDGVNRLEKIVPTLMSGATKVYLKSITEQFIKSGLRDVDAEAIAVSRAMYTALNIIEVATIHKFDLIKTARVYFDVGGKFNLVWFRDQIANDSREGHWNTLARLSLRDELDSLQRQLTIVIMKSNKKESDPVKLIDDWRSKQANAIERWEKILHTLLGSANIDYVVFFITLRELEDLIQGSLMVA